MKYVVDFRVEVSKPKSARNKTLEYSGSYFTYAFLDDLTIIPKQINGFVRSKMKFVRKGDSFKTNDVITKYEILKTVELGGR